MLRAICEITGKTRNHINALHLKMNLCIRESANYSDRSNLQRTHLVPFNFMLTSLCIRFGHSCECVSVLLMFSWLDFFFFILKWPIKPVSDPIKAKNIQLHAKRGHRVKHLIGSKRKREKINRFQPSFC